MNATKKEFLERQEECNFLLLESFKEIEAKNMKCFRDIKTDNCPRNLKIKKEGITIVKAIALKWQGASPF